MNHRASCNRKAKQRHKTLCSDSHIFLFLPDEQTHKLFTYSHAITYIFTQSVDFSYIDKYTYVYTNMHKQNDLWQQVHASKLWYLCLENERHHIILEFFFWNCVCKLLEAEGQQFKANTALCWWGQWRNKRKLLCKNCPLS